MQWRCRARVGALNANRNDPFRNVIGTWIAASWRGYEGAKMRAAAGVIQGDMNENISVIVSRLSDDELVSKVKLLAQGSRQTTVQLIAHLAELAARGLHRREGPGKLFGYCTQILRLSEAAACNRIKAAKAARKFPVILDRLADGSVNLTTVRLLAPHLTSENHLSLLAEAPG